MVRTPDESILYVCTKFEADIALFVQKLLRGSQNLEIRSRNPSHAHLLVVL